MSATAIAVASMAMSAAALSHTSGCSSGAHIDIPEIYLRMIVGLTLLSCVAGAVISWIKEEDVILSSLCFIMGGLAFLLALGLGTAIVGALIFVFTGTV